MSTNDNDMDRYFNDPEYRREQAKSAAQSKKNSSFERAKVWFKNQKNVYKFAAITSGVLLIGAIAFLFTSTRGCRLLNSSKIRRPPRLPW